MSNTTDLGSRLKSYEAAYETVIPKTSHIIVRIDGHKFSKFTKGFNKPFDSLLANAMIEATKALLIEFKASTAYTQSDEITLIIPAYTEEGGHNLGGRVQKIVSLTSGFTTMVFNKTLRKSFLEITPSDFNKRYVEMIESKLDKAYFDARVYAVDSKEEAFNSLLWRIRDAEKNSRSNAAYAYLPHKDVLTLNGTERIELLKERTGIDWNDYDDGFKYGVIVKKEKFTKEVDGIECVRSRVKTFSEKLHFSPENVEMVFAKTL